VHPTSKAETAATAEQCLAAAENFDPPSFWSLQQFFIAVEADL
jgi:hypothetical protein